MSDKCKENKKSTLQMLQYPMILRVRELPINLKLLAYPKTTIDFTHCHGLRSEISGVRFPLKVMLDSVFKALLKPARCRRLRNLGQKIIPLFIGCNFRLLCFIRRAK
ncbi:hypothetical protein CEXT_719121 [Caerostris extrusa]|uniref:Uncharacterized protein n=1 Tax=Caerostris extrusa TaxID=172846 RepID=A0AAV4U474_CAEEX|nr:hypothetical protein CEXT_719121 [Caerostris extrusa]